MDNYSNDDRQPKNKFPSGDVLQSEGDADLFHVGLSLPSSPKLISKLKLPRNLTKLFGVLCANFSGESRGVTPLESIPAITQRTNVAGKFIGCSRETSGKHLVNLWET